MKLGGFLKNLKFFIFLRRVAISVHPFDLILSAKVLEVRGWLDSMEAVV